MADRVFLHVGLPKSGTSYLQTVLWSNRDRLLDDGYLLPGSRAFHYAAMSDLRGGTWQDPDADGAWQQLCDEVRAHEGPAVVSEEMLGAATAEQADCAVASLAPAEVHVVLAVRDLGRSIPSAWQQGVRARAVGGFSDFVDALQRDANPGFWANQSAVPVLRRWTSQVPPERRHVVVVPRQGAPREQLWQRFAQALALDPDRYPVGTPVGNPSLGAPEAELLRRVNAALGDEFPLNRPYGSVVRSHLTIPVLLANPAPARFTVPAEAVGWVEERSEELVRELAGFSCDLVGDLEDLSTPPASSTRLPDDYSAEEMAGLAVATMVGMLRHTNARIESWRRTVQEGERREELLRAELQAGRAHRRPRLRRLVPRRVAP